ncbi:hypothetical protein AB0J21_13415 [Streptomyces sp. NPDC049954]|uniref:hypothetical protein n=1 Tax=Streptomyces sp. NPDC049954 TaxID=3155779 RepID=UPI0034491613
MGWAVLYLAFAVVALWLLGEVLLQYKARLRWRLLAFGGFLLVVLGVLLPSVVVIALGAIAFATGQTLVTLSFRRGFAAGWALGGKPGASKRRRDGAGRPALEVSDLRLEDEGPEAASASTGAQDSRDKASDGFEGTAVLESVPASPAFTGTPGQAPFPASAETSGQEPFAAFGDTSGQESFAAFGDTSGQEYFAAPEETSGHEQAAASAYDPAPYVAASYDTGSFGTASPFGESFAATSQGDTGGYAQVPYGSYDTGTYATGGYDNGAPGPGDTWGGEQTQHGYAQPYAAYGDPYTTGAQGYDPGQSAQDPYATTGYGYGYPAEAAPGPEATYATDTPPGGVWVPQQRAGAEPGQQPYVQYPGQPGYGDGGSDGQGRQY